MFNAINVQLSVRLVNKDNYKYKSGTQKKLETLIKVEEVVTSLIRQQINSATGSAIQLISQQVVRSGSTNRAYNYKLYSIVELNKRLNYKSIEIKWYKYMKVDPKL